MSNWLPSLNALRALEATARNGSYKKAADELSVTPAAVKQLVAKLEAAIGSPLLERSGQGMALTQVGLKGGVDLTSGFRLISLAVERMRSSEREGSLVVSVDPSLAASWLAPRLNKFKGHRPDVEVLVNSSVELADLEDGSTDVGIRFGVENHGELVAHRLFDEELSAFCSPTLANGPPEMRRLEDLEKANLLRWDLSQYQWSSNTRLWNFWKTWLAAVGGEHIHPAKGVNFSDYNLAVQAAIAGQGFVIGSRPILSQLIESDLLVDPFGVSAQPGIGYDIVASSRALLNDQVRDFVNWVISETGQQATVRSCW